MPARLFHFRLSHYNEKVRWALDFKRWPHARTALVPGFHVPRVRLLTGQNKLPALVLDGRVLVGSNAILAEIERLRPDPPLYPADPALRDRALALEKFFDDPVAPDLRRLFWSTYIDDTAECARLATDGFGAATRVAFRTVFPAIRPLFRSNMGADPARIERAQGRLEGYFDRLESEIGPSGFLVGDGFTAADLCVASVMTAIVRPPGFPYPLPEPIPQALADLRGSLSHRPGFRWVEEIYARHRPASCELP